MGSRYLPVRRESTGAPGTAPGGGPQNLEIVPVGKVGAAWLHTGGVEHYIAMAVEHQHARRVRRDAHGLVEQGALALDAAGRPMMANVVKP